MLRYEKYFEPEYGDIAKGVYVPEPERIDLLNPRRWRERYTRESAVNISLEMQRCHCYEELMETDTEEIRICVNQGEIAVKIYYPEGEGPFPIVLFCHGGAFMMNNFDVYEYVCRYIARYGRAVVVMPDYRLAPEHKYPTGLMDCYCALEWVEKHAERLRGDVSSVSVCGDSSGGNFAAALCLLSRDRKGPCIHRQIMVYPLLIFKPEKKLDSERIYGKGYFLEYDSDENPLAAYFQEPKDMYEAYASPILAEDLTSLPQAVILSAECDPLLDQALIYARLLEKEGVKVEYHMYKGMLHGFLNRSYEKSFECLEEICRSIPVVNVTGSIGRSGGSGRNEGDVR